MSTNQTGKMIIAIVMVVIVASAGYFFIYLSNEPGSTTTPTTYPTIPEILPIHNSIAIVGDADFANQAESHGWSGDGSAENPYLIEDYSIVNDTPCIYIRDVSSHFIIRNCALKYTAEPHINRAAIWIRDSENGIVDSCQIVTQGQGVEFFLSSDCIVRNCIIETPTPGAGINATLSEDLLIRNNTMRNAWFGIVVVETSNVNVSNNYIFGSELGITFQFTGLYQISDNTVSRNQIGIELYYCSNGTVLNNTVIENEDVGIKLDENTVETILVGNKLGWNNASNAIDDGRYNEWDDGISQGNFWSDYNGTGQYFIPGTAGSIDDFPAVLEPDEN